MIVYPRPLRPGDTVGVTAPSLGVPEALRPRLDIAVERLRARGLTVRIGAVMGDGPIESAPAPARADELRAMMTDPLIRAIVPPWGGEVAVDLLELLDWDQIGADPTWLVGFSDISTLMLPLTVLTGIATVHGQNLMETPYRVPPQMLSWLDVVSQGGGATLVQGAAEAYRAEGYDRWEDEPTIDTYSLDTPAGWVRLDDGATAAGGDVVDVSGRLIGGCLETVAPLAGTSFGDVSRFAAQHAPEGLIVYLEALEADAADVARRLMGLRYAGWFERANAILIGRTRAPGRCGFAQHDAVRHALGNLGVPVLADVECGHVPPYMALVNGALARVRHSPERSEVVQRLVP